MSSEEKLPPQEQTPKTINPQTKKKRQEYLNTLENLLQSAQAKENEISEIEGKVKEEYASFQKEIEGFRQTLGQTSQQLTNEKQNSAKLVGEIRASKTRTDELADEISDFHTELFGDEESEDDKGLKHNLETAYKDIQDGFKALKASFEQFQKDKTEEFSNLLQEHAQRFESTQEKIESLLPGALSAGLSSAFQKKREAIEKTQRIHYLGFIIPIVFLVVIFCSTFWASTNISSFDAFVFFICRNLLIASPILWLAIFFNRRLNLDTRLIEEYTHKETVSKTFEGLSKEIQKLEEEDSANQLRQLLLQATMEVNTTNPGKLVKGYDTIDHPISEIASTVTALSSLFKGINEMKKLPGFDLAKILGVIAVAFKQNPPASSQTSQKEDGEA